MTATAFMSVSLDPPLVLVSLRTGARMDDLLDEQPLWAVSVLAESQRHIAGRFAMKGRISDRLLFEDIPYVRGGSHRRPARRGCAGHPGCRTEQRVTAGDHTLVIGRVLTARVPSAEGARCCTSAAGTGSWAEPRLPGPSLVPAPSRSRPPLWPRPPRPGSARPGSPAWIGSAWIGSAWIGF
ncbi:flavin reductase family protein [Streptomyces tricolor]|nr:flavin reductase family protein [Streptomyces tricolor]